MSKILLLCLNFNALFTSSLARASYYYVVASYVVGLLNGAPLAFTLLATYLVASRTW